VRDGDVYRLTGHKMWASGADHARYGIVYARTDKANGRGAISAFIVDSGIPGITVDQDVSFDAVGEAVVDGPQVKVVDLMLRQSRSTLDKFL
jgi:alkylation response protein AidB-like acyl-CoA dehydrogenase